MEKVEAEKLSGLRTVFQQALGLTFEDSRGEHFFRSSLIQTLFYGIFSAWVLWDKRIPRTSKQRFEWRTANWDLKIPVLRKLFSEVAEPGNLDESGLVEILDWAGETLNRVDRPAFFRTFQESAAVQYFYEPFLEAFDPDLRKQLGVWYTPPEIVQYMVARIDNTLRDKLGMNDGLADKRVFVLDPCCGTGTFLVEVLNRIAQTLRQNGEEAFLAHEVKHAAISRVFGFELLTAPFVVAHLEISALIQQLGGDFAKNERPGVYLTNALTGWEPPVEPKTFLFPEFQQESDDADRVKRDERILVILGNPPYNSFAGMAEQEEERHLTTAYRMPLDPLLTKPQGQGLNDLYIRFFRIAERRIVDQTNEGLVCFISNYSWLDGLSHTVMRERFLKEFDEITIDCLNGDKYRTGKLTPDGKPDPSVFSTDTNKEGIQVGTAIALLLRTASHDRPAEVHYRELWGAAKRAELALESHAGATPQYQKVIPKRELGLMFRPATTNADYTSWPLLTELFPVSFPGIKTSRDSVVIDIDRDRLEKRMKMYFDPAVSFEELKPLMSDVTMDTSGFNAKNVRKQSMSVGYDSRNLHRYLYRPYDARYLYWETETKLLDRARAESRIHHVPGNVWLEARQKQPMEKFDRGYVTRYPGDNLGNGLSNYFPLYLSEAASLPGSTEININLSQAAAARAPSKESIFFHAVSILNTPAYRHENNDALRQDWPRIPLPNSADLLTASAALGRELADLLDPDSPVPGVTTGQIRRPLQSIAIISCTEDRQLDPARDLSVSAGWGHAGKGGAIMPARGRTLSRGYSPQELETFASVPEPLTLLGAPAIDVYLNDAAYWRNIPEAVWEYTIGGYQVLKKWLSYREQKILSRPLHVEEARLFTQVARRIAAILLLGPQLDSNYESVRANTAVL